MILNSSNLWSTKGDNTDTQISIQLIADLMFAMMNMGRIIPNEEEILSKDIERGKKRVR